MNRLLFDPLTVPHVVLDATFTDKLDLHFEVTRILSTLAQRRDRSLRVTLTVVANQPGAVTESTDTANMVEVLKALT